MKESVIRKVFCALNWPPKTGAFQKLITFVVQLFNNYKQK